MNRKYLFLIILIIPTAQAVDFTEDFEDEVTIGLDQELKPDEDWYNYLENGDTGFVSRSKVITGTQSFYMTNTEDQGLESSQFSLQSPTQISSLEFVVDAGTPNEVATGSQQYVTIESINPIRKVVEFYIFCRNATAPDACQFKVRFDHADTTGLVLYDYAANVDQFTVIMTFNWQSLEYNLNVNGNDDGDFPFLEIPPNFGRISFGQHRSGVPYDLIFDDWTVNDAIEPSVAGDLDIAGSIQNTARNLGFENSISQFFFGLVIFIGMSMALIFAMLAMVKTGTIGKSGTFFTVLTGMFMIDLEFWPQWIAIGLIILVSALVGNLVRTLALGIKDASNGPSLVAGSLGYFIIATSLLSFSGYATDSVAVPREPSEQTSVNETENPDQSFIEATTECIVTGFSTLFGGKLDCSRKTESKIWGQITDIFGWVRTGLNFLFQLLTFQLPIPVIFSAMIVLPPAATLGTFAIQVIRG